MNQILSITSGETVSLTSLAINFAVGVILSLILTWHYRRYGTVLANRSELARIFPMIALTTLLIITVVKYSLALSLGLVGALSVIRFRTPIKEPEELAYLFLAIAIGVGLGASQTWVTATATLAILAVMAIYKHQQGAANKSIYVCVSQEIGTHLAMSLEDVVERVSSYAEKVDLRRIDTSEHRREFVFLLELESVAKIAALKTMLEETYEKIDLTILDQNHLPNL